MLCFEYEMYGLGPVVDGISENPADSTGSSPCLCHVVCCLVRRAENLLQSLFSRLELSCVGKNLPPRYNKN